MTNFHRCAILRCVKEKQHRNGLHPQGRYGLPQPLRPQARAERNRRKAAALSASLWRTGLAMTDKRGKFSYIECHSEDPERMRRGRGNPRLMRRGRGNPFLSGCYRKGVKNIHRYEVPEHPVIAQMERDGFIRRRRYRGCGSRPKGDYGLPRPYGARNDRGVTIPGRERQ